jgi:superfamily II DNA/RNA helicase
MILRLALALEDFGERQAGPSDILALLRQIIRAYARRLEIHHSLWQQLSSAANTFGLQATTTEQTSDLYEIRAVSWQPTWLSNTDHIDELQLRRNDQTAIGDGLIAALSDGFFTTYQSEAQKIAVQESLFAPPGSTHLITLPTGAGKSLCIQLPAWQESQGGRIKGGTTLVIVPTVSLALDQEERAKRLFSKAFGQEFTPASLTGATPEVTRIAIYKGIEQGTLPILFTSPESLMTTSLYHVCLEAARRGTINRLVIDEAHLVETWGAGFRTEFQFLSAYRKQLLEASQGQLRTLLLSATVPTSGEKLLKKLFGDKDTFYSLRADRLRPEIAYWFDRADNQTQREMHVLEAIRHLPRPIILYVISPDDTTRWLNILKEQGFSRVAAFSGDTRSDERLRLIKAWNEDRYDVMVATSAFGVGVDKSDVRTVIHACLPENIDRYYQEVGRAGRDGYSAISLLSISQGDLDQAKSMNRTARITTPKAISRWKGMQRTHRSVPEHSDIILVDTNATPSENQEMFKGPSNREWNEHTLLIMQRAGMIKITDLRTDLSQEDLDENTQQEEITEDASTWLQIQLLDPHTTSYPDNTSFAEWFEHVRKQEVDSIHQTLNTIQTIVSDFTSNQAKRCLAFSFTQVYTRSTISCGGCPFCRRMKQAPYSGLLELEREGVFYPPLPNNIPLALRDIMGNRQQINVFLDESCNITNIQAIEPLLVQLIHLGFQQLILPDAVLDDKKWSNTLIQELAHCTNRPHLILPTSWLINEERPIYSVPTIVIYPLTNNEADVFHQAFRYRGNSCLQNIPVLAVAHRNLFLRSEQGTFFNRINGLSYSLECLQEKLPNPDELVF